MKYNKMNLGQIEALINKVGGPDGVKKILSGRVGIVSLKPWQTVNLGTFQSEDGLRKALDGADLFAGYDDGSAKSSKALKNIEISKPQKVNLVIVAVEDLGLSGCAKTNEIYEAADELGLDYCPDETAAQVLLQCKVDLTSKERIAHELQFAMDPNKRGGEGFRIRENEGKNYLTRFTNTRFHDRMGDEKFVFVLRK